MKVGCNMSGFNALPSCPSLEKKLVAANRNVAPSASGIKPGSRNVNLTSFAGSLRARGLDEAGIAAALVGINATLPVPLPEG